MTLFIKNNFIGTPNPFMTGGNCCHHHNNNMMPPSMFGFGFQQPMMFGGCVHHHHGCGGGGGDVDDGIGKAMLWGAGAAGAVALLAAFHKPIGKFLVGTGKLIGQGATWLWNKGIKPLGQTVGKLGSTIWNKGLKPMGQTIGKWGSAIWNKGLKPMGQAIGKFFKNIWNGIKGIFKKKPKNADEVKTKDAKQEDIKTETPELVDSQIFKSSEIPVIDNRPINDSFIS